MELAQRLHAVSTSDRWLNVAIVLAVLLLIASFTGISLSQDRDAPAPTRSELGEVKAVEVKIPTPYEKLSLVKVEKSQETEPSPTTLAISSGSGFRTSSVVKNEPSPVAPKKVESNSRKSILSGITMDLLGPLL